MLINAQNNPKALIVTKAGEDDFNIFEGTLCKQASMPKNNTIKKLKQIVNMKAELLDIAPEICSLLYFSRDLGIQLSAEFEIMRQANPINRQNKFLRLYIFSIKEWTIIAL